MSAYETKRCADCNETAKIYDMKSRVWWCTRHWRELLRDYRASEENNVVTPIST